MSILTIIIVLVVVGFVLWLINSLIPMEARIKQILNVIVIIFLVIWILKATGIFATLSSARI